MLTAPDERPEHRDKTRKIRALFINDTSRNGGPGRTILDILKYLDAGKIHRTVLVPREGIVSARLLEAGVTENLLIEPDFIENLVEPMSRAIERKDFEAPLYVKLARGAGNLFRAMTGLGRLLKHMRSNAFDVVFCNGTMANFVGGAIAVISGVPVIWHVLYSSVPTIIRPLHSRLAASRNVRSIVCVSRPTARQFDHCQEKVRVIPDALDIAEFARDSVQPLLRAELRFDPGTVIFGSHGRVLRRKGFVELIRASKIVLEKLGDAGSRCRFVVLGDTPQDFRPDHLEECRMMVREFSLEDKVFFLGYRSDVRPYLRDIDVAIVPSVYEDPLPRSVMESMAMSKPVIAFDVGGIGEMICDGVEGSLVRGRPPDIEALADACMNYFNDSGRRLREGAAARARVERDFDARKHSRVLQEELIRVLDWT